MKRFFAKVKLVAEMVLSGLKSTAMKLAEFLKSFFKTAKEDDPIKDESASNTNEASAKMQEMVDRKNAEAQERSKDFDPYAKARKTRPLRKAKRNKRK